MAENLGNENRDVSSERSTLNDVISIYIPAFLIFLGMSIISPVLSIYANSFGVPFTLTALAISIYAVGRFITDLPVGILADKVGRKPLMVGGTAILAVTSFLNATAPNFWLFLAYRFLEGVGSAMWSTSRQTLLADVMKPNERGRVMGYFQAFILIGSAAGPTVGGVVATLWGLNAPFYFYSLAGLVTMAFSVIWVHEPKKFRRDSRGYEEFSLQTTKRLLSNRTFAMACLATFTTFFLRNGINTTIIPLYSNHALNLSEVEIGTVLSYATLMNLILTVPIGHALDRFGRKPIIISSFIVQAAACFLFPSTTSYLAISVTSLLLGIGQSGANQGPVVMATDASINEPHGTSMGLNRASGDLAYILGPIALGALSDAYGLRVPFYFTGAVVVLNTVLLAAFARETYSKKG